MSDHNDQSKTLKGVCHLFSETGTEGGSWAIQDERFITKNIPRGYCKKCGKWLGEQSLEALQVERVSPVTEEVLEEGKLPKPEYCPDGECEEKYGDEWSYKGLHCLEDGDHLTIYSKDKPDEVVWSGVIKLQHHPLFTEHASGFWIHADQEGIDRDTWAQWFFDEHPVTLVKA